MPVLAGDSREAWKPDVLADPRVTQLWDPNQVVGTWLQQHGGPFWDAFLVYGPTARWQGRPTTLGDWGSTIIGNTDQLTRALRGVL
jgi:hypothetical protein